MYTLMVSYDCGISYHKEQQAETLDELKPRCAELDAQMLRWGIDDEDGRPVYDLVCARHQSLFRQIQTLRGR